MLQEPEYAEPHINWGSGDSPPDLSPRTTASNSDYFNRTFAVSAVHGMDQSAVLGRQDTTQYIPRPPDMPAPKPPLPPKPRLVPEEHLQEASAKIISTLLITNYAQML